MADSNFYKARERRRSDRIDLNISGALVVNERRHHEFSTDNVSNQGMMISVGEPYVHFAKKTLSSKKCKIYFNSGSRDDSLSLLSRICWIKGGAQENSYKIGIRYLSLDKQQKRSISSLIRNEVIKSYPVAVKKHIPPYILCPRIDIPGRYSALVGQGLLLFARAYAMRQRAYLNKDAGLSKGMVKDLYDRESRTYLSKHAITTHRKDDSWRLWLAQTILTRIKEVNRAYGRPAQHIDIFSGTGLSYQSQVKVFSMENVHVNSVLVDYSEGMLRVAENVTLPALEKLGFVRFLHKDLLESEKKFLRNSGSCTVELARGDATSLTGSNNDNCFIKLDKNCFDVASIMFGLGAVPLSSAIAVSVELLKILSQDGIFATTDIHRPVSELAGRWGWPLPLEFRWPWFEKIVYEKITVPYVLRRLWAWHDPTLYPYLMKLAVYEEDGKWFGWEEVFFELESQSWDFGIPIMPTYKQVLRKKIISKEEALDRKFSVDTILKKLSGNLQ